MITGRNFNFKPGTTRLEMVQEIREKGSELEARYEAFMSRQAELSALEQQAILKSRNAYEQIVLNTEFAV